MNLKQDYKSIGGKVGLVSVLFSKIINDTITNISGKSVYVDLESLIFEYVTVSVIGFITGYITISILVKYYEWKGEGNEF